MSQSLILDKKDGFYSLPLFENHHMRALFTTRKFDMAFEGSDRPGAYKSIGLDGTRLVCPSQVHADTVFIADEKIKGAGAYTVKTAIPGTDALITTSRHLPLAVLTADCLPLFIADTQKNVISVVHGGWRSLHKRIVAQTVQKMFDVFKSDPADIIAVFGPCIRPCCYEVGQEFVRYFPESLQHKGSRYFLDLVSVATFQLVEKNIDPEHVYDSRICTCCASADFFSFRREGAGAGRSMSVLELT